ncbi:type II and III secretion system protein, partial [Rhodopirellula sallentina SM41]
MYRPLPHRISVDDLIQESLDRSNAVNGGDEQYVQPILDEEVIVDEGVWENGEFIEGEGPIESADEFHQPDVAYGSGVVGPSNYPAVVHIGDEFSDDEIRIDEEYIETDVREVLMMLATEAELDLVMDDNVGGIVNAQVRNLTVDQAIEKVLMPLGLAHAR